MKNQGVKNPQADLSHIGVQNYTTAYWNLAPDVLVQHSVDKGLGKIASNGALVINTGKFTGRSPLDRFIVKDAITENSVDWNDINMAFPSDKFDALYDKVAAYFEGKEIYVRDAYACADKDYALKLRLVSELPWSNQFAYNMFLRLTEGEVADFSPEWTILCAPSFMANPAVDGTRQENFAILNFTRKAIIIGGTGYTGEIKKGIFSALNYILPHDRKVLAMHCSANVGESGDAAVFFGLSGTGKTTLSADPNRKLIGDDEHGWSDKGIFNFEGGCYAKTIDLTEEKEPDIFKAIRPGAILENIGYKGDTNEPDYMDASITQNTRVSYPIHHIDNIMPGSQGGHPQNIFFLTADAFGVLPPISKLTPGQAMFHFISGYTAKVAGTEEGVVEPQGTFSACFGAPFMPLHPTYYAQMLAEKMRKHGTKIWLVNTGWTGGAYGTGSRIKLKYTRAMIQAALTGQLDDVTYETDQIFGLSHPTSCPNVPDEVLNPRNTWSDASAYDAKAKSLATSFNKNFEQFADQADEEIIKGGPIAH